MLYNCRPISISALFAFSGERKWSPSVPRAPTVQGQLCHSRPQSTRGGVSFLPAREHGSVLFSSCLDLPAVRTVNPRRQGLEPNPRRHLRCACLPTSRTL